MQEIRELFSKVISVWKEPKKAIGSTPEEAFPDIVKSGILYLSLLFPIAFFIGWVVIGNNGIHIPFLYWIKVSVLLINAHIATHILIYSILGFLAPSIGFKGDKILKHQVVIFCAYGYFIAGAIFFLVPSSESWWLQPIASAGAVFSLLFRGFLEEDFEVLEESKYIFIGIISGSYLVISIFMNYIIFKT